MHTARAHPGPGFPSQQPIQTDSGEEVKDREVTEGFAHVLIAMPATLRSVSAVSEAFAAIRG
jgi:hypothetical protein